jgi:hypothetical protein
VDGTVLSHYRLACINFAGYPPDRHLLGAIGRPDETTDHERSPGDNSTGSSDSLPELVSIPPDEERSHTDISGGDVASNMDEGSINGFLPDEEVLHRYRLHHVTADGVQDHPSTSDGYRLQAMRTVHSSNVRRKDPWGNEQPRRSSRLQATLAAEVLINGVKALTLFDSGSTTDSITPEFAFITKANQFKLEEQVILQLGCVGSRSKISYGTKVPVEIGGVKNETYFDLVNIDRYDCIIGTPFMNAHGVCLDFGNRCIIVKGEGIQALSFDEEQKYVDKKKSLRAGRSRAPPRETAPIRKRIVTPLISPTT